MMDLDMEMELWETRSKGVFGIFLTTIETELDGYLPIESMDFGLVINPIKSLKTRYCLDGNVQAIFNELCMFLQEYDYCNLAHPSWSNHHMVAVHTIDFAKANGLTINYVLD